MRAEILAQNAFFAQIGNALMSAIVLGRGDLLTFLRPRTGALREMPESLCFAKTFQRGFEILRQWCFEFHLLFRARMFEDDLAGMKHLARNFAAGLVEQPRVLLFAI